jgi:hypothetical protein
MADELTLTIRVHDPKEKHDPALSACWATVRVDRAAISLPMDVFIQQFVEPALKQIKSLKFATPVADSAASAPTSTSGDATPGASGPPSNTQD